MIFSTHSHPTIRLSMIGLACLFCVGCSKKAEQEEPDFPIVASSSDSVPNVYSDAPVETTDRMHPFIQHLEAQAVEVQEAAAAGDWDRFCQVRTTAFTDRIATQSTPELTHGDLIRSNVQMPNLADYQFLECKIGPRSNAARLCYSRPNGASQEFYILMFRLEETQWRLGDSVIYESMNSLEDVLETVQLSF